MSDAQFSSASVRRTGLVLGLCLLTGSMFLAMRHARLSIEREQVRFAAAVRVSRRHALRSAEPLAKLDQENVHVRIQEEDFDAPKPVQREKPVRAARRVDLLQLLRDDPHLQLLQLEVRRSAFRANYRPLLEKLGLNDAEAAELERIMLQKETQVSDLQSSALAQGLAVNDPSLRPLWDKIHREATEARLALLGEEGERMFEEFERTSDLREMVGALAGAAALAGDALSREQAEALVQILAESSDTFQSGAAARAGNLNWAAADARAAGVLSARQLRVFQTMEAMGSRGMGSRYLPRLNHLIHQARDREAEAANSEELAETKVGQR